MLGLTPSLTVQRQTALVELFLLSVLVQLLVGPLVPPLIEIAASPEMKDHVKVYEPDPPTADTVTLLLETDRVDGAGSFRNWLPVASPDLTAE
jgi:hypothetical protein